MKSQLGDCQEMLPNPWQDVARDVIKPVVSWTPEAIKENGGVLPS